MHDSGGSWVASRAQIAAAKGRPAAPPGWACRAIAGLILCALLAGGCSPSSTGKEALPASMTAGPASAGPGAGADGPADRWTPEPVTPWQWELAHPLNLRSARDMGMGVLTYRKRPAPDPVVYDIDGFDNPARTVAALHQRGDHVICYLEVGAAENYRPDYSKFSRSDLGRTVPDYPDETYLNITSPNVVNVIESRIAMCAAKGFDAVEPDIDDSYAEDTGFPVTKSENVAYDTALAKYAHSLGLSWALKNGDDPAFAGAMEPVADFVLDEQCFQYSTCNAFTPFLRAGKAVLEVEYDLSTATFCPAANGLNFNAERQNIDLSGGREPCR